MLLRPVTAKNEDYLKQLESLLKDHQTNAEQAGEIVLKFLLIEHAKIFVEEKDVRYMKKDGNEIVSCCTLAKLLDLMLDDYYVESNYVEVVLLTHQYYISSVDLLNTLLKLYPVSE